MSDDTPAICDGKHPSEPIACQLDPGPNATTDPVHEVQDDGQGGSVLVQTQPAREVHVHRGLGRDGTIHRWEDAPEEVSE